MRSQATTPQAAPAQGAAPTTAAADKCPLCAHQYDEMGGCPCFYAAPLPRPSYGGPARFYQFMDPASL